MAERTASKVGKAHDVILPRSTPVLGYAVGLASCAYEVLDWNRCANVDNQQPGMVRAVSPDGDHVP